MLFLKPLLPFVGSFMEFLKPALKYIAILIAAYFLYNQLVKVVESHNHLKEMVALQNTEIQTQNKLIEELKELQEKTRQSQIAAELAVKELNTQLASIKQRNDVNQKNMNAKVNSILANQALTPEQRAVQASDTLITELLGRICSLNPTTCVTP